MTEHDQGNRRPRVRRVGDIVLGGFRLDEKIGAGAFATTYLAEQLSTGRVAVVKLAHAHLLDGDNGVLVRGRFENEMLAATAVRHPSLVTVYSAGQTDDGIPAIAMEFVAGDLLETLLGRDGRPAIETTSQIVQQLANGLARLHAVNIIHRDVSPGNIIVHSGLPAHATLLDFGLAKLESSPQLTLGPIGTPRYMAPEQIRGEPTIASDVFSLGAIAWWAVTGHEHLGQIHHVGKIMEEQLNLEHAPDPRRHNTDVPDDVAALVQAMMSPNAAQRPSAQQVAEHFPLAMQRWRTHVQRQTDSQIRIAVPADAGIKRAVLVTGNTLYRSVFNALLKDLKYQVDHAKTAYEALELCEQQPPNVLMVVRGTSEAHNNPVTSSFATGQTSTDGIVVRAVRELLGEAVRIVVVSDRLESQGKWRAIGADQHIRFPHEVDTLKAVLTRGQHRTRQFTRPRRLHTETVEALMAAEDGSAVKLIDAFLREIPATLTELSESVRARDRQRVQALCKVVLNRSVDVGALHLASLADNMNDVTLSSGEQLESFVDALADEFSQVFRELFRVRSAV